MSYEALHISIPYRNVFSEYVNSRNVYVSGPGSGGGQGPVPN